MDGLIREIKFRQGLNLIVDETPTGAGKSTGNSVGKTTALMLVDFCLGGSPKQIYTDPETGKDEYRLVKDYLIEKEVLVSLCLTQDLSSDPSGDVCIERNFLSRKRAIRRVSGQSYTEEGFKEAVSELLVPGQLGKKPTYRQIISHNIRYSESANSNTLKTLDKFTRDEEYESLYLFMFGCDVADGEQKQMLLADRRIEQSFLARLQRTQSLSGYEATLAVVEAGISRINAEVTSLGVRASMDEDLRILSDLKVQAHVASEEISHLQLKEKLITDAARELRTSSVTIDMAALRQLYMSARDHVDGIQKSFEQLVEFHNGMLEQKAAYIERDLTSIRERISSLKNLRAHVVSEERSLASSVLDGMTYERLSDLNARLNDLSRRKGEAESQIASIRSVNARIDEIEVSLRNLESLMFSRDAQQRIQSQLNRFNVIFSEVSQELYGESFAVKVERVARRGASIFKFSAFNTNMSSGKKQGEIACFDLAYTIFADDQMIPCVHFLLNDKRELMHGNQLARIAALAEREGIQFVASMLRDKLPAELNQDVFIVTRLSQRDKLFRIEKYD
ncbi:DUF2326 domain-containing protein [Luteibacter sp.]|uniref:DUF2326 domain-containing protein n=1 Tax=Luteibacter sp. TaxID=1886636 RepID=UPI003F7DFBDE